MFALVIDNGLCYNRVMIITPMIRNNICLNAHPEGCVRFVRSQIDYVRQHMPTGKSPIKNALIIGASAGYGLASRVVAAFGYRANTLGVAFEKEASGKRTATPGWYCDRELTAAARADGLRAETIIGDAFSDEMRERVVAALKERYGTVDLVIYSLASGSAHRSGDGGTTYRSALKPIGKAYRARSIDPIKEELLDVSIDPATDDEIAATVKVMGGEDWRLWSDALLKHGLLSAGALNIAYSYIGPALTFPVYRDGTIGRAKKDLERRAAEVTAAMAAVGGHAYVSVNKAVVTRASAVIPVVPLYLAILFKVMKARDRHEDVIHQMHRLFTTRLYGDGPIACDDQGRIRIDDWEMDSEVQREVERIWPTVNADNLHSVSDLAGYKQSFLNIHGFGFADIDYDRDISP